MFDSVTAGSHSLPKDFRVIGPAAAALHLLAIGGLMLQSWWRVGDFDPPGPTDPMPVLRVSVRQPRGASGEVRNRPALRSLPSAPRKGPRLLTPAVVPKEIPLPEKIVSQTSDANGSSSGTSGAEGDPRAQGNGWAMGTGEASGDGGEGPFLPGGDVEAPRLLYRVEPPYPEAARKLRREGVVTLEAIITAAGSVEEVRVVASADPLLDEAARRAVRQWRYRAGSLNGRPVSVILAVQVSFELY